MGPRELTRAARIALAAQETFLRVVESRQDPHEMTIDEAETLQAIVGVGKQAYAVSAVRVGELPHDKTIYGVRSKRLLAENIEGRVDVVDKDGK